MNKDRFLFADEDPLKRINSLSNTADEVVNESYYQRLTADELQAKKVEFTANALEIEDLEDKKKKVVEEFKGKIKPIAATNKILSSEIRSGFVQKEGRLFKYIDQNTKMANYYDESGEQIDSKTRPATADELSCPTIQMGMRTGTY